MTAATLSHVRLAGIVASVPATVLGVDDLSRVFGEAEARKISESSGVVTRYVAPPNLCTSDLCAAAAEKLLEGLGWVRESVDLLIFVSQTPDYVLPPTACVLQRRLGLPKSCAAFDVNLGCSGFTYGLWMAASLLSSGGVRRALLLVGDTVTHIVSPLDRALAPLFSDAGSATALEHDVAAGPMHFELGTDGRGSSHLIVPAGGARTPHSEETARRTEREGGNVRSDDDLFMDGAEVFAFTLREVPGMIRAVLARAEWGSDGFDACVMHQANLLMLQYLMKKLRLPSEKVVLTIGEHGNTSSASIPLAMAHALGPRLSRESMRLVLAGFGVGYSWGSVALECGPMFIPAPIVVDAPPPRAP
jgi:3-oxoacyl-[acyl-carrier-protein] synthase-3